MEKNSKIKQLFEEIFTEAEEGTIKILENPEFSWKFYTKFYASIDGYDHTKETNYPTVVVPNFYELCNDIMPKYLKLARRVYADDKDFYELDGYDFDKFLTLCLLVDAGTGDLQNFNKFVRMRTEMLKHKEKAQTDYIGKMQGFDVYFRTEDLMVICEAPYKFTPLIRHDNEEFILPSVVYGIVGDTAFVYAIQGKNGKQKTEPARVMDRYFRKVNNGVNLGENDDDPENIYDGMNLRKDIAKVSPNAVVSLTMFLAQLKSRGITKVVATDILPIRYVTEMHATKYRAEKAGLTNDETMVYLEKRDSIQNNVTNSFMHLFARYCFHFSDSEWDFDDMNGRLYLKLNPQSERTDNIIFDIDSFASNQNQTQA